MDSKILDDITNSIKTKLGEDNVALISDDLGMLITENNKSVNTINDLNKKVDTLTDKNNLLSTANSRLLSQIPMEKEDTKAQEKEEKPSVESFTLKDLFFIFVTVSSIYCITFAYFACSAYLFSSASCFNVSSKRL